MLKKSIVLVDINDAMTIETAACFDQGNQTDDEVHIDIPARLWADMGEPEQITVTVEPGDQLNNT